MGILYAPRIRLFAVRSILSRPAAPLFDVLKTAAPPPSTAAGLLRETTQQDKKSPVLGGFTA
jgi:hypothetical protein